MPRSPRLIIVEPTGARREVPLNTTPFRIGRQTGNELTLRDSRISRQQAQIIQEGGKYVLEDLGSRHGTLVNGQKVNKHELRANDTIEFGVPDSYQVIYQGEDTGLEELLHRVETSASRQSPSPELYHLGVLLEVARVLHTSMSVEDVLSSVLDAAIQVTHTERGVLMLVNQAGELEPTVARDSRRTTLRPSDLEISLSVLKQVARSRRELIVTDTQDDAQLGQQASVVRLSLHTVVAIPLEKFPMMGSLDTTMFDKPAELLGVLYLDSHSPSSAFSELDREVLRSLALEAATVIENAKLFAAARSKERMDHELKIASGIQQQLLPKKSPVTREFALCGLNIACESIGGDFFDYLELPGGRCGVVVSDISGKGITAALLAAMVQGVFTTTAGTDISLGTMANRVNKFLCERFGDERYATLFYGVFEPGGQVEYINAGHVPPLVKRARGGIVPLESENFPLGMFDFAEYRSDRSSLEAGDFVVLCSDGITEARNMAGDLFGETRLSEAVESSTGSTAEELSQHIQARVREFTGGAPQADDMTLVVLHYRGRAG
jgi:sigma-B regulation protein RsbU (phosphoserine phosphatase)